MESPEDQVPLPQDEDSTPEEEVSSDPKPRIVTNPMELMVALKEAAEEISEERAKELRALYGEETFDDQGITYAEDLAAYDEAAYTRNSQDYTAYRYNLGEVSKTQDDYYYGEQYSLLRDDSSLDDPDGLGGDLDAGSLSGAAESSKYPASGTGYYGKGGKGGKSSYSYTGAYSTGGSWGSWGGGWMSSWYRGYNSSERAIEGVHDNVSSFVTAPGFGSLEIVPDLEPIADDSVNDPTLGKNLSTSYSHGSLQYSSEKTMVVRIDSTLYEKLGIAEAQQHYVVDAISQILAIQTYGDPFLITLLQAGRHKTVIPSVTKEIITEMMRAKGLPILIDQMPGWMKRVTAFRSAMYIGKPANTSIPAAFLMYAIWERDVVETIEHQDAIKAIEEIEEILNRPVPYLSPAGTGAFSETFVRSFRDDILIDIDTVLVRYITGHGSAGEILRVLRQMEKLLSEKVEAIKDFLEKSKPVPAATWESDKDFYRESCEMLIPLVHDHNRTFCPNPSDNSVVRHLDFPDCPNISLLRREIKGRVEFSRKCLFNLERIPGESIKPGSVGHPQEHNVEVALKRVCDMIQHIEKAMQILLAAAERASGGNKDGEPDKDGRRGTNCTNHPELRIRNPIGGSTDRNFSGEDPAFNREVIVFDSTI